MISYVTFSVGLYFQLFIFAIKIVTRFAKLRYFSLLEFKGKYLIRSLGRESKKKREKESEINKKLSPNRLIVNKRKGLFRLESKGRLLEKKQGSS